MSERLSVILTELRERFSPRTEIAELEAYLSSAGFDHGQIGKIVSAFLSDLQRPAGVAAAVPEAMAPLRVIGPHEQGRFQPAAWGLLLSLRVSGVMSAHDLEEVIERVLAQSEGRVTPEDVRSAVEASGLDAGMSGPGQGIIH
jgi:uncharacterized protein Smg (DUF494 family)